VHHQTMGLVCPPKTLATLLGASLLACSAITGVGDLTEVPCIDASCSTLGDGSSGDAANAGDSSGPNEASDAGEVSDTISNPPDGRADVFVGADAGGDGGSLAFCLGMVHTFCADFDEASLSLGWSTTNVDPGGTIAQNGDSYRSPPFAFLSTMQAGFNGNEARLYKTFAQAPASLTRFAFDMRIEQQTGPCHIGKIEMPNNYRFVFGVSSPPELDEEGPLPDGGSYDIPYAFSASALPNPAWNHVEVDFQVSGAPTVVVYLNNAIVLDQPLSPAFQPGVPTVALGSHAESADTCVMRYDNATVDLQ
jgi:hypothetical protein